MATIRRAQLSDLPVITLIYNQAVRGRMSTADEHEKDLAERTQWFAQFTDLHPLWVLEHDSEIVAYGGLFRYNPRSGYRYTVENTVYVHDDHKGKGYGRVMLEYVLAQAKALGHKYVQAKIFSHNEASLKLHRSVGFVQDGFQHNVAILDGNWVHCALLALHLDRSVLTERVYSGSPWEAQVGYCRALKREGHIFVSGTTSMKEGKVFAPGDVKAQAVRCFEIIESALNQLGATLAHVVRTRVYVTDINLWAVVAEVHADLFKHNPPAATMVEVKLLIDPDLLVEIEADAYLKEK